MTKKDDEVVLELDEDIVKKMAKLSIKNLKETSMCLGLFGLETHEVVNKINKEIEHLEGFVEDD